MPVNARGIVTNGCYFSELYADEFVEPDVHIAKPEQVLLKLEVLLGNLKS